ncbi:MAG: hypothetical protein PQ612_08860 [Rickettsiales bacterium]|nr:hypothetical protein [Pseudomonadota bacterium]MDA0967297.1 hypothetical protein [Pseudomonadota bacterium]MDG4544042.1 hypothetical protein [Rickettsiales bacterium]MDG4546264.1 hypothetical protein [Rickettsiales bacterium]MDG4548366.1 hypothetical protein [Rickettsiales bacterium]
MYRTSQLLKKAGTSNLSRLLNARSNKPWSEGTTILEEDITNYNKSFKNAIESVYKDPKIFYNLAVENKNPEGLSDTYDDHIMKIFENARKNINPNSNSTDEEKKKNVIPVAEILFKTEGLKDVSGFYPIIHEEKDLRRKFNRMLNEENLLEKKEGLSR